MALVAGEGTDISNNPSLANRAKRKVISRKMILSLIDVVKEKGEPEREQAYWNATTAKQRLLFQTINYIQSIAKTDFVRFVAPFGKSIL